MAKLTQEDCGRHIKNLETLFDAAVPLILAEMKPKTASNALADKVATMAVKCSIDSYSAKLEDFGDKEEHLAGTLVAHAWGARKLDPTRA